MRRWSLVLVAVACGGPARPPPETAAPLVIPPMPAGTPTTDRPSPRTPSSAAPPAEDAEDEDDDGAAAAPAPSGSVFPFGSTMALPCKTDAECMTHRCNVKAGKCLFPCRSNADCVAGFTCFNQPSLPMPMCLPAGALPPPTP